MPCGLLPKSRLAYIRFKGLGLAFLLLVFAGSSEADSIRRFADLSHGQVHYWYGSPEDSKTVPFLFLPPGPHSARVQKPLIDAIARIRPVYAPDIMGTGDSEPLRPAGSEAPPLPEFAASMLEFADEIGLARFAVYGSNLSARIALEMSLQQPDRIHTLILNRMIFFEGDELADWAANHVPQVQPDQEGRYVMFLWNRLKDLNTYVPWFRKGDENLRGRGLPSADILHVAFTEQVKMATTMHQAFDAYWAYPLAENLPKLEVRTYVTQRDQGRVPQAQVWSPVPLGGNVIEASKGSLSKRAEQFDSLIGP